MTHASARPLRNPQRNPGLERGEQEASTLSPARQRMRAVHVTAQDWASVWISSGVETLHCTCWCNKTGSTCPRIHQEGTGVHVTRRSRPRTTVQSWPERSLLRVINILRRGDICVTEHKCLLASRRRALPLSRTKRQLPNHQPQLEC